MAHSHVMANALVQYQQVEYARRFIPPYGRVPVPAEALDHLLAQRAYEPGLAAAREFDTQHPSELDFKV